MIFVPYRKHTYEPPLPVTAIALLFICRWYPYLTENTYEPPRPVTALALLLICRWYSYLTGNTPMGLHDLLGDSYTVLYVDDVRTLQETHIWASTACYGNNFTSSYVDDVCTSQETQLWASTALRKHSYEPPRLVTRMAVWTYHGHKETQLWTSTACYADVSVNLPRP
jgi:hypothetical protein